MDHLTDEPAQNSPLRATAADTGETFGHYEQGSLEKHTSTDPSRPYDSILDHHAENLPLARPDHRFLCILH